MTIILYALAITGAFSLMCTAVGGYLVLKAWREERRELSHNSKNLHGDHAGYQQDSYALTGGDWERIKAHLGVERREARGE